MDATRDRSSPALARFGAIDRAAVRAEWASAQATGLDLRVVDDGEVFL